MECYYCNLPAIMIHVYYDEVDGTGYDFPKCLEHKYMDDFTEEAIEIWKDKNGLR